MPPPRVVGGFHRAGFGLIIDTVSPQLLEDLWLRTNFGVADLEKVCKVKAFQILDLDARKARKFPMDFEKFTHAFETHRGKIASVGCLTYALRFVAHAHGRVVFLALWPY